MTRVPLLLLLALPALALLAWAGDRVALWMEDMGWIFYRRSRLTPRHFGNALLTPFALVDPGKRHVIERRVQQEEHRDTEARGGAGPRPRGPDDRRAGPDPRPRDRL